MLWNKVWAQLIPRALESILVATSNALEEEMGYTRNLVRDLLADLEDDINRDNLKRLLHYSRRMAGFQSRARYVKRAVDEVLESGASMSLYRPYFADNQTRIYQRCTSQQEQWDDPGRYTTTYNSSFFSKASSSR
jgi:hypothetical protein